MSNVNLKIFCFKTAIENVVFNILSPRAGFHDQFR